MIERSKEFITLKLNKFKKFVQFNKWRIFVAIFLILHTVAAIIYGPLPMAEIAILESAIGSWLFVGMYAVTDWYKSSIGVQLMSMGILFALLTTISLIPLSGPILEWVAFSILTLMALILFNLVRIIMKFQRIGFYKDK